MSSKRKCSTKHSGSCKAFLACDLGISISSMFSYFLTKRTQNKSLLKVVIFKNSRICVFFLTFHPPRPWDLHKDFNGNFFHLPVAELLYNLPWRDEWRLESHWLLPRFFNVSYYLYLIWQRQKLQLEIYTFQKYVGGGPLPLPISK